MEKRNTMLLTVIAIATLLVAVIGATFAYFATTQNVDANVPIDVKTAAAAASFTAFADGEINVSIDAYKMQQADANETTETTTRDDLTDSANLNVVLKAAAQGQNSECRYNIIWTWTNEAYENPGRTTTPAEGGETPAAGEGTETPTVEKKHYWPTTDVVKEFTIEGTAKATNTVSGTVTTALAETNFSAFPEESKQVDNSGVAGSGNADNYEKVDFVTLVRDAKIIVSDATNGGSVVWNFTVRFYNSTKDQSALMGKSLSGTISVDPDSVAC